MNGVSWPTRLQSALKHLANAWLVLPLSLAAAEIVVAQEPAPNVAQAARETALTLERKDADSQSRYWAILIGVDKTKGLPDLTCCAKDVKLMREALILNSRFHKNDIVTLCTGSQSAKPPTGKNINETIEYVSHNAAERDVVLFTFSGHGVYLLQDNAGVSFLCPEDTNLSDPATLIAVDDLYQRLGECKARKKILVLDACRNAPVGELPGRVHGDEAQRRTKFAERLSRIPENTVCLLGCKVGQESLEDRRLGHGVFMWSVVDGLKGNADLRAFNATANNNRQVELIELFTYAASSTKQLTCGSQEPEFVARSTDANVLVDLPETPSTWVEPVTKMEFTRVRRGKFIMGGESYENERPRHEVTLTDDFYFGITEVTQRQYAAVMSDSLKALEKEARRHADYPATFVTHAEAEEFCLRLSSLSNLPRGAFRLPTEAEWEYAARAGTEGPFGAAKNENGLVGYAWFSKNSGSRIHEVKSLSANPWGLHDLQGNVAEWCSDWYDPEYYKQKGVPSENPTGPSKPVKGRKNPFKLLRGGSWFHGPEYCHVYDRNAANPLERYQFAGFRVVFTGRPEIVGSNQLIEEEKK